MALRVRLAKLLKAERAGILRDLTEALGAPVTVLDPQGAVLFGPERADCARLPVSLDGALVGWVCGEAAGPVARLISLWVSDEAKRKALANEALHAYREITLLYKLADLLAGSLKTRRLLSTALREARRLIHGAWGVVLLLEVEDAPPTVVTSFGEAPCTVPPEALWRVVQASRKAEIVNDLRADARFGDTCLQGLLWAPLITSRRLLGVLAVGHKEGEAEYSAADLSLLTSVAAQAAPAVENAILYEDLERLVEQRTAELSLAKEEAEAASQAKTRFLAHMSHELRTPLNALLGYAQILGRGPDLTVKQSDGLAVIRRSGEHLLTLINDLLDLSKIEADQVEMEAETFDLHELVGSLAEIFQLRAQEQGLRFESVVERSVARVVHGDARKLRQVLMNLLGNAMKYTDAGTVRLNVSLVEDQVRFAVTDTGIGIGEADQKQIFGAFRQVLRRDRTNQGTGLGLAISERLVRVMGGALSVRSVPGVGSTFAFVVPLPASDAEGGRAAVAGAPIVGFEGGPYRALVVEDDAQNREVLRELLGPLGFEIHEAVNGREGVERARALRPHVVLMDIVMPEMDGYEAIQNIRSDPTLDETVIVVLSASVFPADRRQSIEAGGDAFVPKPVDARTLFDALGELLDIQWRYAATSVAPAPAPAARAETPPAAALRPLYEAVLLGRIAGVREALDALSALDAGYAEFVEPLRALARGFRLDALKAQLEAQLGL